MSPVRHIIPLLCACLAPVWAAQDLVYRPPTDNHALFENRPADYFMYCDRTFEGEVSKPWEAGSYGMVRNPFRAGDGNVMFSRFHEGIDVKPLRRDAAGEPLDEVRPLAPGRVVHVSDVPRNSNYGNYVVVAHEVPEGTIYTLYAHLAKVSCSVGQQVGTGNTIGIMGHTGVGLNRERSHVHVEVCLLLNSAYDQLGDPLNKHGIYNGMNLVGMNAADFLLACKDGKPLSLTEHFKTLPEHYRVRITAPAVPDILRRHPFLYKGGDVNTLPAAYDIAFTAEGVPIAFYPAAESVTEPKVLSCKPLPTLQQNVTCNRVKNSSKDAALTVSGRRYVETLVRLPGEPKPAAPKAAPAAPAAPAAAPAAVAAGETPVNSPMPGNVFKVECKAGQAVNAGDVLVVLEAMKMEIEVAAPCAGTVKSVAATVGSTVNTDDLLVVLG